MNNNVVYKNIFNIPFWGWIAIAIFIIIIAIMAGPAVDTNSTTSQEKFSQFLEWNGEKYEVAGYLTGNENALMEAWPGGPNIPYQRLDSGVSLITLAVRKV